MERFARDILRLKCEVYAEHYDASTLSRMTGREVTEEMMELMRDDQLRRFRIDVETDSTIQPDADTDKQQTVEFVQAVFQFLQASAQLPPTLYPLTGEMLKFAIRRFKVGRELEEKIDETVQQLTQQAQQPQPNPEAEKAKAEIEADQQKMQAELQMDQQKLQGQMQLDQARLQGDMALQNQRLSQEQVLAERRFDLEAEMAKVDAALKAYTAKKASEKHAD
jgi:hypothetical protein